MFVQFMNRFIGIDAALALSVTGSAYPPDWNSS
jgi:hypothetical protein